MVGVPTTVPIDKAGRIVIPKTIRDELGLCAGDDLELECTGQTLTLKPLRQGSRLRRKMGVWVFQGGGPITQEETDRVLREIREGRGR